jgi:acyl-CoA dehydrogenase
LVKELRNLARQAGVLSPHLGADGKLLSHRATATILRKTGLSPLGPVACNTAAPDEGNMYLLEAIATEQQRVEFLKPLLTGDARSVVLMTEPAKTDGAGSDPSMLKTLGADCGSYWQIDGCKTFATGFQGATIAIILARTETPQQASATMFIVRLPHPAIRLVRLLDTIDSSFPGGHAEVSIEGLRVSAEDVLGELHNGMAGAQMRLAPARLSHCMRWHGAATRAQEIATAYARERNAFGKSLIDHEGVGFMLAENLIDLKQSELMIEWCAAALDAGSVGITESSMTKVSVSEALFRVADRCVQVMGGTGVSRDTIVEQVFRETRAFRIYDGPNEVHKWSLAKQIKRNRVPSTI